MATEFETSDKAMGTAFEAAAKDASITGIPSFTLPIMTAEQYVPDFDGVAPTLPADNNKDTGAAVAVAIRSVPLRLKSCTLSVLPPANQHTGSVIFSPDAASGAATLLFSDGTNWRRADSLAIVP